MFLISPLLVSPSGGFSGSLWQWELSSGRVLTCIQNFLDTPRPLPCPDLLPGLGTKVWLSLSNLTEWFPHRQNSDEVTNSKGSGEASHSLSGKCTSDGVGQARHWVWAIRSGLRCLPAVVSLSPRRPLCHPSQHPLVSSLGHMNTEISWGLEVPLCQTTIRFLAPFWKRPLGGLLLDPGSLCLDAWGAVSRLCGVPLSPSDLHSTPPPRTLASPSTSPASLLFLP